MRLGDRRTLVSVVRERKADELRGCSLLPWDWTSSALGYLQPPGFSCGVCGGQVRLAMRTEHLAGSCQLQEWNIIG